MSPTVICRAFFHSPPMEIKKTTRSEERRVGKDPQCDWSSDVCSSDLEKKDK